MGHQFEGPKRSFAIAAPPSNAIPFIHRLAVIRRFQRPLSRRHDARRRGCRLISTVRGERNCAPFPRPAALAYSTESMRLTTRLMQVASWLLLQRAVNEGELTSSQAQAERVRVKLSREDYGCAPEIFEQLPLDPAQPEQALAPHSGARHPS